MSDLIREAQERREKLLEEVELIDRYLALHERIFGSTHSDAVVIGDHAEAEIISAQEARTPKPSNDPVAIAHEIEGVLANASEPMTRGQIRSALKALDVVIHSKDVSKYLGTLMWRNQDRFMNIEGKGYWLKARPLPRSQAGQDPLFS